jgi:serine/threonine protein kinase
MPVLTPEERVGTLLAEKYQLGRIIGRGGMGVVYEATHTWTNRQVAIKLLHATAATDPDAPRRFLQEARTGSALKHPNVVEVLDMGSEPDGAVYLVLEMLHGEPLSSVLARGALSYQDTCGVLLPVMGALSIAHDKGFIHRDLKPDNVFLHHEHGVLIPKLLDFGIAKTMQSDAGNMTRTGVVVGTPAYISPEQAIGTGVGPVSDVWAMGIVAFECLTGRVPFEGETATAVVVKVVTTNAPSLAAYAGHPEPIVRAIDGALVRETAGRYPHMRQFAQAMIDAAHACGVPVVVPKGIDPNDLTMSSAMLALPPASSGTMQLPSTTGSVPQQQPRITGSVAAGNVTPMAREVVQPEKSGKGMMIAIAVGAPVLLLAAAAAALAVVMFGKEDAQPVARTDEPVVVAARPSETQVADAPPEIVQPAVPQASTVELVSDPPGAHVQHEGADLGDAPVMLPIPAGERWSLTIALEGHEPRTITVASGQPRVSVRLQPVAVAPVAQVVRPERRPVSQPQAQPQAQPQPQPQARPQPPPQNSWAPPRSENRDPWAN